MASEYPAPEAVAQTARPRRTVVVLGAALVSGVAGYVVLVLTARSLDAAENADFLVFWGTLFGVFGVLIGLSSETTRAVFAARRSTTVGVRVVAASVALGVGSVVVLGSTGLWWGPHLFGPRWQTLLPILLLGVALFAVHCGVAGALAGRAEWDRYASLVAAEPTVRVLAVACVTAIGGSVGGFALASAAAAGTWLLFTWSSRHYRSAWHARADVTWGPFLGRVLGASSASAASALILVGFPVLLRVTTSDGEFSTAAPLLLAVSLSRAPLLVPLGAYQTVAMTKVMTKGVRALTVPVLVVVTATAVGVVLAYPAGPPMLRLLNPDYEVAGATFSGLVVAAGLVSLLTLSGAVSLALDRHASYLAGWLAATCVTVVVLSFPWSLETRTVVALVVGPLVGIPLHLLRSGTSPRKVSAS
jgi:O-antigen/teichoic acid export membrane protein